MNNYDLPTLGICLPDAIVMKHIIMQQSSYIIIENKKILGQVLGCIG